MKTTFAWLKDAFVEAGQPSHVFYRYGGLLLCGLLLMWHVWWILRLPANYPSQSQRLEGFVVPLMLLLNHLAFAFQWSRSMTVLLRTTAVIYAVATLMYSFGGLS